MHWWWRQNDVASTTSAQPAALPAGPLLCEHIHVIQPSSQEFLPPFSRRTRCGWATRRTRSLPIRCFNYRDTSRRNRHVAFLPACMSTSGRIHGELLRLIFFLSNKQADDYFAALGYQPHKQEFCHRRGVFFQQNRGTIGMACAQAVALRGAPTTARRHVAAPRRPLPLHMAYDDQDRNVSHIHGFA